MAKWYGKTPTECRRTRHGEPGTNSRQEMKLPRPRIVILLAAGVILVGLVLVLWHREPDFSPAFLQSHGFVYRDYSTYRERRVCYEKIIPLSEIKKLFGFSSWQLRGLQTKGGCIGDIWQYIDIGSHSIVTYYYEGSSGMKVLNPEEVGPLLHKPGTEIIVRALVYPDGRPQHKSTAGK